MGDKNTGVYSQASQNMHSAFCFEETDHETTLWLMAMGHVMDQKVEDLQRQIKELQDDKNS